VKEDSAPAQDPKRIIFVGQIIPGKGLHLLFEAVNLLVGRGRDVRLDVVGQNNGWIAPQYSGYREQLLLRANQPDLIERVHFLGWHEDVPHLLKTAAVHCCPSLPEIREAFGLVIVEAKEAGIPSVVFNTGAMPELVEHRIDGWICNEVSAAALAEGLEYFLTNPCRSTCAGDAARYSLRKFSRESFAAAWSHEFDLAAKV
jgi:glycosyltransferase involved in cell wall biosynthesis